MKPAEKGATMETAISDEVFKTILREHWEQIACFAYDGYLKFGRGIVEIIKTRDGDSYETMDFNIAYSTCDLSDPYSARLMMDYDPEDEVIIRYEQENFKMRTILLKTPPGERNPQRISLLEEYIRHQPDYEFNTNFGVGADV
jgi:hypothetical protein